MERTDARSDTDVPQPPKCTTRTRGGAAPAATLSSQASGRTSTPGPAIRPRPSQRSPGSGTPAIRCRGPVRPRHPAGGRRTPLTEPATPRTCGTKRGARATSPSPLEPIRITRRREKRSSHRQNEARPDNSPAFCPNERAGTSLGPTAHCPLHSAA